MRTVTAYPKPSALIADTPIGDGRSPRPAVSSMNTMIKASQSGVCGTRPKSSKGFRL